MLQSFTRVHIADASLLGAPLFHGPALDTAWNKCCDNLALAAESLRDRGSHDALTLLRSSFGAPEVLHLLRCAPSVGHEALEVFDCCLRDAIHHLTNSNLSLASDQFQLKMEALGWDVYLHSQFLPTWLKRQAHSHSMRKSCQAVPARTTRSFKNTCQSGHLPLAQFQTPCQGNNHSGTVPASKLIVRWWKTAWVRPFNRLPF